MKTVILGKRSALTSILKQKLKNVIIVGTEDLQKSSKLILPKKFNLIINLFYSSKKINNITDYDQYFKFSIYYLTNFLSKIKKKQINKIIYTSSAAVYGDIIDNHNKRNFYASTKILIENYLKNLKSIKNKLVITRLFNLYEFNDVFSLISKIVDCKKKRKKIILYNDGEGVRDFIKITDVVKIYKKLLQNKFIGTIDIGTGEGIQIKNLIDSLKLPYINKSSLNEQKISIANISKLKLIYPGLSFFKIERFFLLIGIFLKKKIHRINFPIEKENQLNDNITIIYGAGFSGKKIYDQIKLSNKKNNIFFIDDNVKLHDTYYKNSPIISFEKFLEINKIIKINNIIFSIPSLEIQKRNKILQKLSKINDAIMLLPPKDKIINNKIFYSDLKKVSYLDILDRKNSRINDKLIKYLDSSNVLITGAAGSIGTELVLQVIKTKAKKIICLDINETELFRLKNDLSFDKRINFVLCDINESKNLKKILIKNNINQIFHAAAYKHVDMLENNLDAAIKNNISGTLSLIKSLNNKVKNLIFISTDKAAKPVNILGITKRFSELMLLYFSKKIKTNFTIVRFGNVFGSRGSAIEIFENQIKNSLPITLTNLKAERYFMSITEACNLVMQSSQLKSRGDIYILNMGKQVKIYDIIKKMLNFYNLKDYPILKTKLKKGEKLKEILTTSREKIKTLHPDIFGITEKKIPLLQVEKIITLIEDNNNSNLILKKIKQIKNL